MDYKKLIENGEAVLGIELGSTRIKAVIIDQTGKSLASGSFTWQNDYVDGVWTYHLDKVKKGLAAAYRDLKQNVIKTYAVKLRSFKAIGISAMMHGYLVFDKDDNQLAPFKTWRNNFTEKAANQLTDLFNYPIPQRWSIAHFYHCVLNDDKHVSEIAYMTTLAGYVHDLLTGEKVLGIGDASGMFPVDINTKDYHQKMIELLEAKLTEKSLNINLRAILPQVLVAGETAGKLTDTGAKLLDADGDLTAGIVLCPPEGDAGTGMVATNSVKKRTGNVSAGTSVFAMIVLEKELSKLHREIDLITTPAGDLVAMAYSNNCTSNLDTWLMLFNEVLTSFNVKIAKDDLYNTLYQKVLQAEGDIDAIISYGYVSGEHMTGFNEGRPLLVSKPDKPFELASFMRANLFSSLGALKIGLDILFKEESVKLDKIYGHGGFFKVPDVGQIVMSCATGSAVAVSENAAEGGAWGIALLASFMLNAQYDNLADYLEYEIFKASNERVLRATETQMQNFEDFMKVYKKCLPIERAAVDCF